jgi:hypothetical protein
VPVAGVGGKLTPVNAGDAPNVYIGTAVVEEYCPVTYMFRPESTAILNPISLLTLPAIVEYDTDDLPEKLAPRKHCVLAIPPTSGKRS